MASPYDEELDPLTVDETPQPTGAIIAQSQLSQSPDYAAIPDTGADQFARTLPPAASGPELTPQPSQPPQPKPTSGGREQPPEPAPADYTPAEVPTPEIFHHRYTDPNVEAGVQARDQATAAAMQREGQAAEDKRAANVLRSMRAAGVEMDIDPATGQPVPKRDEAGRLRYKVATISPVEERPGGKFVTVKRNSLGALEEIPVTPKIDPATGEKYVLDADGVGRRSLGVDEGFVKRKEVQAAGQQLSFHRQQLSALAQQRKALDQQSKALLAEAAALDVGDHPTNEQRVALDRIQKDRARISAQIKALDGQRAGLAAQVSAANTDFLAKKGALLGIGAQTLAQQSPGAATALASGKAPVSVAIPETDQPPGLNELVTAPTFKALDEGKRVEALKAWVEGQVAWRKANEPGFDEKAFRGQYVDRGGFWGGVRELGAGIWSALVDEFPEAIARIARGGDVKLKGSAWYDDWIAEQEADKRAKGVSYQQLAGDTLATSLAQGPASLATSLATGVGGSALGGAAGSTVAPGPGTVVGGIVGAGALSGVAFYRLAKDQFVEQVRDMIVGRGLPLSEETWAKARADIETEAQKYGAWEAGPEALSQAFTAGLFKGAGKLFGGALGKETIEQAAKQSVAGAMGKLGIKLGAEVGEELATETATQVGQGGIEAKVGLRDKAPTIGEAFQEIAGPTLVGTLLQGGAMATFEHIHEARQTAKVARLDAKDNADWAEKFNTLNADTPAFTPITPEQAPSVRAAMRAGYSEDDANEIEAAGAEMERLVVEHEAAVQGGDTEAAAEIQTRLNETAARHTEVGNRLKARNAEVQGAVAEMQAEADPKKRAILSGALNAAHGTPLRGIEQHALMSARDAKGQSFAEAVKGEGGKRTIRLTEAGRVALRASHPAVAKLLAAKPVAAAKASTVKPSNTETQKGASNAVQKPGATSLLQRQPGEAGSPGGGRGRVEPSQQGSETPAAQTQGGQTNEQRSVQEQQGEVPAGVPEQGQKEKGPANADVQPGEGRGGLTAEPKPISVEPGGAATPESTTEPPVPPAEGAEAAPVKAPFPPQAAEPHIVATAIQTPSGPVYGSAWNSKHATFTKEAIAAGADVDALYDDKSGVRGFVVQKADGTQAFVSRDEALSYAKSSGQVGPDITALHSQEMGVVGTHEAATTATPEQKPNLRALMGRLLDGEGLRATLKKMGWGFRTIEGDARGLGVTMKEGKLELTVDMAALEDRLTRKTDPEAFLRTALDEEITHLASLEAVRREWVGRKKRNPEGKPESFAAAYARDYGKVAEELETAKLPDGRTYADFVRETYGDDNLTGANLTAEFVRQLSQMERSQMPTEGFLRQFVEKILAVLRDVLALRPKWSAGLRKVYADTQAVLGETTAEAQKPTPKPKEPKPSLMNRPPPGGWTEADKVPESMRKPKPAPEKTPPKSALDQAADELAEGLFAPPEGELTPWQQRKKLSELLQRLIQRSMDEAEGAAIFDQMESDGVSPKSVVETFWKDTFQNLSDQQQRRFTRMIENVTGLRVGDVVATRKIEGSEQPEEIVANSWSEVYSVEDAPEAARNLEGTERGLIVLMQAANQGAGQMKRANAAEISTPLPLTDQPDRLQAPPEDQKPIPPEKAPALVKFAVAMLAEGKRTPEAVAAYLEEKFSGRARPFTRAIWDMMGAMGGERGEKDWGAVYGAMDGPAESASGESPVQKLSFAVSNALSRGETVDRRRLAEMAKDSGLSTKEIDEAAEMGVVMAARAAMSINGDDAVRFDAMLNLYQRQPNLTAKTSTSKINQAYSTPIPLAFLASRIANISGAETVLEPTAGNGALLLETPKAKAQVNELDPRRASALRAQGFTVTEQDATRAEFQPATRVLANPPFGVLRNDAGEATMFPLKGGGETREIDHAISLNALSAMNDGGRAVLIIGGTQAEEPNARRSFYGTGERGEFFRRLYREYGVIDHFTVDGDLYSKQGAGWPVDVIVIAGRRPSPIVLPTVHTPRILRTWDEAKAELTRTDDERIRANQYDEERDRGELGESLAGIRGALTGTPTGGERAGGEGDSGIVAKRPGGIAEGAGIDTGSISEPDTASALLQPPSGQTSGVGAGATEQRSAGLKPEAPQVFHAPYVPVAEGPKFGIETPINMAEAQRTALERVQKTVGKPLTDYVREKLGYRPGTDIGKYFAAEQTDAIALAIYNIETGGALVVADQTGIGKGRVAAALIEYAKRSGRIPIFVSKEPKLYAAMLGDVDNIGKKVSPIYTNSDLNLTNPVNGEPIRQGNMKAAMEKIAKEGKLPEGKDVVFTTYDQIGKEIDPSQSKESRDSVVNNGGVPMPGPRNIALQALGSKALFILDESHLAAGDSIAGRRLRALIEKSPVYYSSATFAKRPDAMPLYFRTNLRKADPQGRIGTLVAVFENGGVTMQQVASQMLAADGQLLRRERSYQGVTFQTHINVETEARDRALADQYTSGLRTLMDMSRRIEAATSDLNKILARAGKKMNVPVIKLESADFASQVHNFVSQYLFAIKAEATAQQAIKAIRDGYPAKDGKVKPHKVIVAVQNTMEGPIGDLVASGLPVNFNGLLLKTLNGLRTLRNGHGKNAETFQIGRKPAEEFKNYNLRDLESMLVVVKTTMGADGNPIQVGIVDQKVAMEYFRRIANDQFETAEQELSDLDLGDMPISPIDHIRQRIESAGTKTAEITGRSTGIRNGKRYEREASETTKKGQLEALDRFNNSDVDALVINASGSTGVSAHASSTFKRQDPRIMIVAQPHLDINEFMQTLGRIFRSGQVELPRYMLLQTALPAEKRPAAILGKKMAALNANTTSNTDSEVSSGAAVVDMFNEYGDEVVWRYLADNPVFRRALNWPKVNDGENVKPLNVIQDEMEEEGKLARGVASYAAILPLEEQDAFWEKVVADYNAKIAYLDQIGENKMRVSAEDIGAETVTSKEFTKGNPSGESEFDKPSFLETVKIKPKRPPLTAGEAMKMADEARAKRDTTLADFKAKAAAFTAAHLEQRRKKSVSNWGEQEPKERARLREQESAIAGAIRMIGEPVIFNTAEGKRVATVIGFEPDSEAPLTPSKQTLVLATNTLKHEIRLPVSQIAERTGPLERDVFTEQFTESREDKTERRIITGNLVAAFAKLEGRGKVVSYTKSDGSTATGIMLPQNLDAEAEISEAINTPEKVMEALRSGRDVTDREGRVRFDISSTGLTLTVPAAKATGGRFWQDAALNRAMQGGEFEQRGGKMVGNVQDLRSVLDRFRKMEVEIVAKGGESTISAPPEEPTPSPTPTDSALVAAMKTAVREMPETQRKVLRMRLANAADEEIAKATGLSAAGVEGAYRNAIGKVRAARQRAEELGTMYRAALAEQGPRKIGRPELANPATGEKSRRLVDALDETRKLAGVPTVKSDDVTQAAADAAWEEKGRDRIAAELLDAAQNRGQLTDEETLNAKRLIRGGALQAIRTSDPDALYRFATIANAYRVTGTEQARAFRARRDAVLTPTQRFQQFIGEAILRPSRKIQKALDKAEKDGDKARKDAIIKQQAAEIAKLKAKLAKLGLDVETLDDAGVRAIVKDKAKAAAAIRAVSTAKSDFWDALYEYWISSILSAPATNVANIAGNLGNGLWNLGPQRFAEAVVNLFVQDKKSARFGDFTAMLRGLWPGLARASRNMALAWRTESPVFEGDVGLEGADKLDYRQHAIAGTKGRIIRAPLRLLGAADDFSKSLFGTLEVQAHAARMAAAEGLTGEAFAARIAQLTLTPNEAVALYRARVTDDPAVEARAKKLAVDDKDFTDRTSDAWEQARNEAAMGLAEKAGYSEEAWGAAVKSATELAFQEEVGAVGKLLLIGKAKVPGLRYIIPFVKTLSNIIKAGVRKSPLGSVPLLYRVLRSGFVKMGWDGSGWSYSKTQFVPQAAEQLIAFGLLMAIKSMASGDDDDLPVLTGTQPYEMGKRGERDLANRTAPPQSVRIGGKWYSYARVEPFATALSATVDLVTRWDHLKSGEDATAAAGKAFKHVVSQLEEKTFARGLADVLNAAQDGASTVQWAGNFATSWVPNVVRATARESDPLVREQGIWGTGDIWARRLAQRLGYKALPTEGNAPQPKVNLWGVDIAKDGGPVPGTDVLWRLFSPAKSQPADPNRLDRLLLNWSNQHPNEIFAPAPPRPYFAVGKKQVPMTDAEYHKFLRLAGRMSASQLGGEALNYDRPTEENIKTIGKTIAAARKEARRIVWEQRVGAVTAP